MDDRPIPDAELMGDLFSDSRIMFPQVKSCRVLRWESGGNHWGTTILFSRDGRFLFSAYTAQQFVQWDLETGKVAMIFEKHPSMVHSLALSPDGRYIASGGGLMLDGSNDLNSTSIELWEVSSGKRLMSFRGHGHLVCSLDFSPDGTMLLSGSWDKTYRLWDVRTGECLTEVKAGALNAVRFTRDGRYIITAGDFQSPALWDRETGEEIIVYRGEGGSRGSFSVDVSRDGRWFLCPTWQKDDPRVEFWHIATGRRLRVLRGHKHQVDTAALSPDCRYAVSGGRDGEVKIWDIARGKCLKTLVTHSSMIEAVAYSPRGTHVAALTREGADLMVLEIEWVEFKPTSLSDLWAL